MMTELCSQVASLSSPGELQTRKLAKKIVIDTYTYVIYIYESFRQQ
jgi:hypothetical protein